MSVLVLAEHNNIEIKTATFNTIFAASKIDSNIEVLLIGSGCEKLAKELSTCQYVQKVLLLDKPQFEHSIAELYAPVIVSLSENYTHIIGPATTFGKNIFPRVAVNLDISQISDVIKIIEGDTFVRPIYAGNALATVRMYDTHPRASPPSPRRPTPSGLAHAWQGVACDARRRGRAWRTGQVSLRRVRATEPVELDPPM